MISGGGKVRADAKRGGESRPAREKRALRNALRNGPAGFFAGTARFRIDGLNLNRFLNGAAGRGTRLYNVRRPSFRALEFDTVGRRGRNGILSFARESNYVLQTVSEHGLPVLLKSLRLRAGLLLGFLLCAATVGAYSAFVWDIRITGAERVGIADIIDFLGRNGVRAGVFKSALDRGKLSAAISAAFDDIAGATVELRGVTLLIGINETLPAPGVEDNFIKRDLKAECDGIVTRIFVIRGTAAARPGDAVKKGQILIAGYTLDASGAMNECRAEGEVIARVWYTAERLFFPERVVYARTGAVTEARSVAVFGLTLKGAKASPYEYFETESETERAFKNFFAPITIGRTAYYELVAKTVTADFEAERESLLSETIAEAELKAFDYKRADTSAGVRDAGGYKIVWCNIETERQIAG